MTSGFGLWLIIRNIVGNGVNGAPCPPGGLQLACPQVLRLYDVSSLVSFILALTKFQTTFLHHRILKLYIFRIILKSVLICMYCICWCDKAILDTPKQLATCEKPVRRRSAFRRSVFVDGLKSFFFPVL